MPNTINIERILDTIQESSNHLLLGNGFSISIEPRFNYKSLLDVAISKLPDAKKLSSTLCRLFQDLNTSDFEKTLKYLIIAKKINEVYDSLPIQKKLQSDIDNIRQSFIESFLFVHPRYLPSVNEKHIKFISKFDKIFTTNYDLLLYWIILQYYSKERKDGFGYLGLPGTPWLVNPIWINEEVQNTFYLHGGFHLYSQTFTYKETAEVHEDEYISLLSKINEKIEENIYPLIVLEGSSDEKLLVINSSPYLQNSFKALGKLKGNLFVFGSSLNMHSDKHLIDQLKISELDKIYIGYFNSRDDFEDVKYQLEKNGKKVFFYSSKDLFTT
ncbi:hypothetical protein Lqui_2143 [Legionella quinlivanii]|uniref:DUF4917 domain-containing protein n=1 Tax=Legionella quinlivanii TaxID=45073 RepID=A0A0W0XSV4_9GAMM|nr:DUF4917 family protein [Legionella quinlivanii]KTD47879.1 hypothetical protein Lqui_2143 [Legionella quinlivanii]SEG37464.1 protein of unknown function [Legionella quinlivanii DSM 21216]STY10127.1 Uncharacterised protein [Legionella quinlivanii]